MYDNKDDWTIRSDQLDREVRQHDTISNIVSFTFVFVVAILSISIFHGILFV